MAEDAPPGWYRAATDDPDIERYWDGMQWTDETRTALAPPPSVAPARTPTGVIGRPRSAGLTILVTILTLGIWAIVWSYMNGEELRNYRGDGVGGLGFLLITLFIAPVTMFVMANEVERLYVEANEHPPITTLWGLWFLLPLIGNLIWYVTIQRAINDFWQARGGTMTPGLA